MIIKLKQKQKSSLQQKLKIKMSLKNDLKSKNEEQKKNVCYQRHRRLCCRCNLFRRRRLSHRRRRSLFRCRRRSSPKKSTKVATSFAKFVCNNVEKSKTK